MMPRKAMLLAAGLGKRMRPLTDDLPKPLIEVVGKTLIDHGLDWLAKSGVQEVVVNTHYKAESVETYLAKRLHPLIHISREETLLETGGGIKKALSFFSDRPFFSANSDAICMDGKSPALSRLWQAWNEAQMDALLLLHPVSGAIGYEGKGDFFLDEGRLRRRLDHAHAPFVFTGVQLLHPRLFKEAPDGAFSLNILYDRAMAADGTLSRVTGIVHDGAWLHVGTPANLAASEKFLKALL